MGAAFNTKSQDGHSGRVTLPEVQTAPPTLASAQTAAPIPTSTRCASRPSPGETLKQDTYLFQNSGLRRFAMFIVPSAAAARPMYYTGHVNLRFSNGAFRFLARRIPGRIVQTQTVPQNSSIARSVEELRHKD